MSGMKRTFAVMDFLKTAKTSDIRIRNFRIQISEAVTGSQDRLPAFFLKSEFRDLTSDVFAVPLIRSRLPYGHLGRSLPVAPLRRGERERLMHELAYSPPATAGGLIRGARKRGTHGLAEQRVSG